MSRSPEQIAHFAMLSQQFSKALDSLKKSQQEFRKVWESRNDWDKFRLEEENKDSPGDSVNGAKADSLDQKDYCFPCFKCFGEECVIVSG